MGHRHRMKGAIELLLPEREETLEHWEVGAEVVILPDIGLQQPGVIRTTIEDARGGQPVAPDLALEVFRDHECPPSGRTQVCSAQDDSQTQNMNKMFTISA